MKRSRKNSVWQRSRAFVFSFFAACWLSGCSGNTDNDGQDADIISDAELEWLLGEDLAGFNYEAGLHVSVSKEPEAVVSADLDNDGDVDLAVANSRSSAVSILLGNGRGNFARKGDFGAGDKPWAIAAADFDDDGKIDLAVTNMLDVGKVTILRGKGDASFEKLGEFVGYKKPRSVIAADFNGDKKIDLAVVNSGSTTISILLGTGSGTFSKKGDYPAGDEPWKIAAADLNRDGKVDLVSANRASKDMSILEGKGDGSFEVVRTYALPNLDPRDVIAADFNGDGKVDLAALSYGRGGPGSVSVFQNTGDIEFIFLKVADYDMGTDEPTSLTAADLDGDKAMNHLVITHDRYPTYVSVLKADKNCAFAKVTGPFFVATESWWISAADFNGDQKDDIAVTDWYENNVSIFVGKGDGAFSVATEHALGAISDDANGVSAVIVSTDFNDDTFTDIAVASSTNQGISVFLGDGKGNMTKKGDSGGFPTNNLKAIVPVDLDGDGKVDHVIAAVDDHHDIIVFQGDGSGAFPRVEYYETRVEPNSVVAADFNGDGLMDLAMTGGGNFGEKVNILVGQPKESQKDYEFDSNQGFSFPMTNGPKGLIGADFNNDKRIDLALVATGSSELRVLQSKGDGTFITRAYPTARRPISVVAADANGDTHMDLVTANGSGTVSVFLGSGKGTFAKKGNYSAGRNNVLEPEDDPVSIVAGDLDGNGKIDLAVAHGYSNGISILQGDGSGAFVEVRKYVGGYAPCSIVAADFNRDKGLDLAVTNLGFDAQPGGDRGSFSILFHEALISNDGTQ